MPMTRRRKLVLSRRCLHGDFLSWCPPHLFGPVKPLHPVRVNIWSVSKEAVVRVAEAYLWFLNGRIFRLMHIFWAVFFFFFFLLKHSVPQRVARHIITCYWRCKVLVKPDAALSMTMVPRCICRFTFNVSSIHDIHIWIFASNNSGWTWRLCRSNTKQATHHHNRPA